MTLGERIRSLRKAVIKIPHGGNRAERRKGKEARNEKSLAPIIKQNDERGKRMAKQKDGRYRAKITVGTDASGKSIVKYVSGRTKKVCKTY